MAFKYDGSKRTVEGIIRRSKQSGGGYDTYIKSDYTMFKPREGENQIRILPPSWKNAENWEFPIFIHFNVGPDGGTYLCSNKMDGVECPVCEARSEAADDEEAKEFNFTWRALVWLIDRDNVSAGPQWWAMPVTVFRDINGRSRDKKTGKPILIDHPDQGFDVFFNREGSDQRTKYNRVELDREPSEVGNDKQYDQWLDYVQANPLPDILNVYEPEHIEKMLKGKLDRKRRGEDEGDEGSTQKTRRRRPSEDEPEEEDTRSRRRRSEEAEEEEVSSSRGRRRGTEDTDEEDKKASSRRRASDEEEEETESPRSRRGRSKSSDEDEEENGEPEEQEEEQEEEEAEEEEAEEKPKGRQQRRRAAKVDEEEEEKEEEEEEEESPSAQGRRSLSRLKRGKGRG